MGDDNTLVSGTQAHQHTLLSSDGGSLQAGATTFSLSDQSLLVSDGSNLTELGVGSDDETLKISSGSVGWSAGASSTMELIGSDVAVGSVASLSVAISPAVAQSAIAYILVVVNVQTSTGQNMQCEVNSITTSTYDGDGWSVQGGTSNPVNWTSQIGFEFSPSEVGLRKMSVIKLSCNVPSSTIMFQSQDSGELGWSSIGGYNATSSTDFDNILIRCRGGASNILNNSRIDVYRVNL